MLMVMKWFSWSCDDKLKVMLEIPCEVKGLSSHELTIASGYVYALLCCIPSMFWNTEKNFIKQTEKKCSPNKMASTPSTHWNLIPINRDYRPFCTTCLHFCLWVTYVFHSIRMHKSVWPDEVMYNAKLNPSTWVRDHLKMTLMPKRLFHLSPVTSLPSRLLESNAFPVKGSSMSRD
jgi:hypothetical protein